MRHFFVLAALASTPLAASGQGFIVASALNAEADAFHRMGGTYNGNYGQMFDASGVNFYQIVDRSNSFGGFSGRGYAELGATFSPANPGIGGGFSSVVLDACTSAEIYTTSPTSDEERAYGRATGMINFNVFTPQNWSWTGGWQGSSIDTGGYHSVFGTISLFNTTTNTYLVQEFRTSLNGVGDWIEPINFAGVLGPGQYLLMWSHESLMGNGQLPFGTYTTVPGGLPLVSCINSTFSLSAIPAPGTAVVMGLGLISAMRRRR